MIITPLRDILFFFFSNTNNFNFEKNVQFHVVSNLYFFFQSGIAFQIRIFTWYSLSYIHPSTLALTQQIYAKVCIEIDVSKLFIDTLWIGTSKNYGWSISVEYEGNHTYSQYCGLLGHTIGLCHKKR